MRINFTSYLHYDLTEIGWRYLYIKYSRYPFRKFLLQKFNSEGVGQDKSNLVYRSHNPNIVGLTSLEVND